MRRPLAALLLGAVSLAGLVPVAAGATELPKGPFAGPRKPVLKIACDVVRQNTGPAVSCSWSTPPALTAHERPAPFVFRLGRIGRGGRTVVYKGGETTFVDTTVEPGSKYGYRVQAFNSNGRPVAGSKTVRVAVPDPGPDHLRFSCSAEDRNTSPAVACKWSASERRTLDHYRLFKLELNARTWRQVIYRGGETSFVDEKVEAGHRYKYLVQAIDRRGHVIGTSAIADVAVPPAVIVDPPAPIDPPTPVDPVCKKAADDTATSGARCRPVCTNAADTGAVTTAKCRPVTPAPQPEPKPEPEPVPGPEPKPEPEPKREPMPEPKPRPLPEPKPRPLPEPKPRPLPEPKPDPRPIPHPDPKPIPAPARMKLACAPQRFDVVTNAETTDNTAKFAPSGPVVVCEWAAPSDLKVASYALWRAQEGAQRPEGTKQVIFKSVDPGENNTGRYVDRAVSGGHGYAYTVKAFDANGRVIAQSDVVSVSFPATRNTDTAA